MSIANGLRDPIWQGIGALLTGVAIIIGVLLVPDARSWLVETVTNLAGKLYSVLPTITTLLVWVLLVWLTLLTWVFYRWQRTPKDREFKDDFKRGLVNWTTKGDWKNILDGADDILTVTNSDDGGFANPCRLWNDYIFEFDTRIMKDTSTWIIRASSLAKYVMIKCEPTNIVRYFRVQNQFLKLDTIPVKAPLPLNTWIHVRIKVLGTRVAVSVTHDGQEQTLFDEPLLDPVDTMVSHMAIDEQGHIFWAPNKVHFIPDFPSGSVGFRESGQECAHFRHVRVVKL